MRATKILFLNMSLLPAGMSSDETAWHLGFEPHEVSILLNAGLLKPLGHPAANSTKYFFADALEALRYDEKCLSKASDAIAVFWRNKNAQKKAPLRDRPQ